MATADATAVTDREVAAVTAAPVAAAAMRTMSTADTPFLSQGDASEAFAEGDESSHVAEDDAADDREMSMDSPLLPPLATVVCEGDEQEQEQDETSREADLLSRSLSRQSTLVGDSAFAPNASAAPTNRTIGRSTTVLLAPPLRSPDPSDTPSPAAAAAAAPVAAPQAIRRSNALAAPTSAVSSSPVKRGGAAAAAASSSAPRRTPAGGAAGRGGSGSGGRSAAPAVYRMEDLVDTSVRVEPDGSALPLRARAAAATCCGGVKSINQDSFVCTALCTGSGASASSGAANRPDALVLAVADGHGMLGHSASALVARELPLLLQSALLDGLDEEAALRQAVAAMHRHMNDDASALRLVVMRALMLPLPPVEPPQPIVLPLTRRSSRTGNGNGGEKANGAAAAGGAAGGTSSPPAVAKSPQPSAPVMGLMGADYGTTLVACVLRGKRISVAHVGDSRFMLFQRLTPSAGNAAVPAAAAVALPSGGTTGAKLTRDWQLMFSTEDHNAERTIEAERVQREGGKLHHAEVYVGGGAGGHAAGPVVGGDVRVYPNCFTLEEARAKALTLNMSRSLGHIKLGQ
jgi:hypothetical protein